MTEIAKEYGFSFELTRDELDQKRKESDNDVIDILRTATQKKIDEVKTKLSEKLVNYTSQCIINDKENTREKSEFEIEIFKIMERILTKSTET